MRTFLSFTLLLLSLTVDSQDYFQVFDAKEDTAVYYYGGIPFHDYHLVIGAEDAYMENSRWITTSKYSLDGQLISQDAHFLDPMPQYTSFGHSFKQSGDKIYGVCTILEPPIIDNIANYRIFIFDTLGTPELLAEYGEAGVDDVMFYLGINNEGKLILVGGCDCFSGSLGMRFVIFDPISKEIELERLIRLEDQYPTVGFRGEQLPNGNYILSGYGGIKYENNYIDWDMYYTLLDSDGEKLWEKTIGEIDVADGACRVHEAEDGFFLTGILDDEAYIAQLDGDGEIIYEKTAVAPGLQGLTTHAEQYNGHFTALGFSQSFPIFPKFLQFDEDWNLDQSTPFILNEGYHNYLRDMRQTPQGGYLMVGYANSPATNMGWIVAVGHDGQYCQPAPCQGYVQPPDPPINNEDVRLARGIEVFPNPASDLLQVQWENNLQLNAPAEFRLIDSRGAIASRKSILYNRPIFSIDVSDLAAGVYVYDLNLFGQSIASGKVVVE